MSSSKLSPLEEVLRSTGTAAEPEIKFALSRLTSEIKDRLRRPPYPGSETFFVSACRALSRIRGSAHAETRMTCLFDCACFFYINDLDSEALDSVRQLDQIAHRAQSKPWIRKSETIGGVVHAELGNVAEGIIRLSNALEIARELGSLHGELAALNNLGSALNSGGLYRESIHCLERAAFLTRAHAGDPVIAEFDLELTALTNLAQSHYYLENFEAGFHAITVCLLNVREPDSAISAVARSIREFTYVLLALPLKKMSAARHHAATCRRYADLGGARARVVAEIADGLCEVYGGDVSKGLNLLHSSVQNSGRITSLRNAALLALVRALGEIGQSERALTYVREVLGEMRSLREKGALVLLSNGDMFGDMGTFVVAERDDLRALTLVEANLRAEVAEKHIVNTRIETLQRLAITADLKEESSGEHGYRVGKLALLVAKDLGWAEDACCALELAARLHDIGKIGMPDSILLKASPLIAAERHFLNAHTEVGAELLSKSAVPHFRLAEEIAHFHHEWWDGTGYPLRLSGARIPIHARVVALADVFDALTHGRPYADPWPVERAIEEIRVRRGTQFDPEVTDRFVTVIERLQALHPDLDTLLAKGAANSPLMQARRNIKILLEKEIEIVRRQTASEATGVV